MNLVEFARLFKQLGARSAINLDGGGSTTMFLKGKVMNRPSDGPERLVSSALLVLPRSDPDEPVPGPYAPPPGPQPSPPAPSPSIIPNIDLPEIPPGIEGLVAMPSRAAEREAGQLAVADPGSTGGYVEALLAGALEGPPVPPTPTLVRIVDRFEESFGQ